jgi:hypothetical protein
MKRVWLIILMSCLFLFTGNVWADEAALQKEIDQMKQRLQELENKKTSESEGSGVLAGIASKVTVGGVIAAAYQYESLSDPSGVGDFGRGAVLAQPEISVKPTERDEVFLKFGFAAGNGLNIEKQPFALAPWTADLEDDVKDINGRNRSYLLTAWYRHMFTLGQEHTLGIAGGIIDATDYLDENRYSNDEYTQFMNEALVNGPHAFAPSYDIGGAVEWEIGKLAIKGVIMNVGKNEEGNSYDFYGAQAGYTIETSLGEGTYRIVVDTTSDDFSNPDGKNKEALKSLTISFDQELGEILGAWIRFGWSDDKALIQFKDLYSGGINISGKLWGREQDNIGIGYAYLSGGNADIDRTQVAEGYVRFGLNEIFALTVDAQYMDDRHKKGAGDDARGWITGVRLTAEF